MISCDTPHSPTVTVEIMGIDFGSIGALVQLRSRNICLLADPQHTGQL
ncbi:MAG: hypothetical protein KKE31_08925 [Planctomycetes bacterium]|nr:hypothetical protein [Planctomycetota bacterium]MBU1519059.1 hypothetical protein [Planctomycetota bacterium]MBU2458728.1 hypothetical protein [Planctomycetota bacterium]